MAVFRIMVDDTEYIGSKVEALSGSQYIRIHVNANVSNDVMADDITTIAILTSRSDLEVARGNSPVEGVIL